MFSRGRLCGSIYSADRDIFACYVHGPSGDVTGLVRLSVGWLEKLQNRNRFGALIGLQPVGFGSFRLTG